GDYIQRVKLAGLKWPLPEGLSDASLEQQLFPAPTPRHSSKLCKRLNDLIFSRG
ncbi:hypothetical protein SAMN05660330_04408, partial [Desulforhopalus singaporensis]